MRDEIVVLGPVRDPEMWLQHLFREYHCKLVFRQVASTKPAAMSLLTTGPETKAVILDADTACMEELSESAVKAVEIPVFWAVPQLDSETVSKALESGAAGILSADMTPATAMCMIRFAVSNFTQTREYKAMAEKAVRDLINRKQIERAKGILMERFGLSEIDAYQQIRREAMNRRVSIAQLADSIVLMEGFSSVLN